MDDMNDLFNEMEPLIDLSFSNKSYINMSKGCWYPPSDIYETSDKLIIYVEIPGVNKSDIKITYRDGYLFISGFRKQLYSKYMSTLHRMEINTGKFFKKLKINIDIIEDEIEAEYHDGILEITIPKRIQ